MSWTALLVLAAGTYAFKVAGLFLFPRVTPSPTLERAAVLVPAAMLAALVVVQTVGVGQTIEVLDARLVGVAAGGLAVWRKAPFLLVVLIAAGTTAALRALF